MAAGVASSHLCLRCVCRHRVGHNEIIGVMRVGCHAEGLGRDHWNEMLAYPRKPIAHWHPLLEPKKSEKEVRCQSLDGGTETPVDEPVSRVFDLLLNRLLVCVSPAVEGQDSQL